MRDLTCDVSCISTSVQDGEQLNICTIKICHEIMQMRKFCKTLLYIVLKSLANETIKFFIAISLQMKN